MSEYYRSLDGRILLQQGDVLDVMREMSAESVDCIITSPPYWGLRRYATDEAWGLEADWRDWLAQMVEWGAECKRVLKKTGSFWLNLGDCYGGGVGWNDASVGRRASRTPINRNGTPKSLMLLPWRVLIAFQEQGWMVRNVIPWVKSNHMPDSSKDKLTPSWEPIFLLVKSQKYYFNTPRRPHAAATLRDKRGLPGEDDRQAWRDDWQSSVVRGHLSGRVFVDSPPTLPGFEGPSYEDIKEAARGTEAYTSHGLEGRHNRWTEAGGDSIVHPDGAKHTDVLVTATASFPNIPTVKRVVKCYVARAAERYEILQGMCAVCQKPLVDGRDVVDNEISSAATGSATKSIAGDGLVPHAIPSNTTPTPNADAASDEVVVTGFGAENPVTAIPFSAHLSNPSPDGFPAESAGETPPSVRVEGVTIDAGSVDGLPLPVTDESAEGLASHGDVVTPTLDADPAPSARDNAATPSGFLEATAAAEPGQLSLIWSPVLCVDCAVAGFTIVCDVHKSIIQQSHFAVFPEALPEFALRAGCPMEVCRKCGKPRMPIERESKQVFATIKNQKQPDAYDSAEEKLEGGHSFRQRWSVSRELMGYTDCGCNAGFEPGVALDPFVGSGTTLVVAARLGMKAIGIDVSEQYLAMAKKRIEQESKTHQRRFDMTGEDSELSSGLGDGPYGDDGGDSRIGKQSSGRP